MAGNKSETAPDPAGLDDTALAAEVTRLGAHLAAATARLLTLVAEANRREVYGDWGAKTPAQWLSWLTGFAPSHARDHVFVAESLGEFPHTNQALAQGSISFCQAKAITKTRAPGFDDDLVRLARDATTSQLQSVAHGYRRAVTLDDDDTVHRRRYLDYFFDDDEAFVLRGRLGRDDGAIVAKAIDCARDELFRAGASHHPPAEGNPRSDTPGQLRADALVAVAQSSLAQTTGVSSGDCHQVVVHVDAKELTRDGDGLIEIEDVGAIPSEVARRIACDASLTMLLEEDGKILGVGRKSRKIPRAVQRALKARDKMCRFPGCSNTRILDQHHMTHWAHGGATSLDNLLLLCRWHHRLVHEMNYKVAFDESGEPVFQTPYGHVIDVVAPRPRAGPADVMAGNAAAGVIVDRPAEAPEGAGRRINLCDVVYDFFFQPVARKKLPPEVRDPPGDAA